MKFYILRNSEIHVSDTDADEMSIDGSGDETQLNKANKKSTEEHKDPDSRNPKRPILDEAPAKVSFSLVGVMSF